MQIAAWLASSPNTISLSGDNDCPELTRQAEFEEPVVPDQLPDGYAQRDAMDTVADILTSKAVLVKETTSERGTLSIYNANEGG